MTHKQYVEIMKKACGLEQLGLLQQMCEKLTLSEIRQRLVDDPSFGNSAARIGLSKFDTSVYTTVAGQNMEQVRTELSSIMDVTNQAIATLFGLTVIKIDSFEAAQRLVKAGYAVGMWIHMMRSEHKAVKLYFGEKECAFKR